ncbi:hypothetical protein LG634_21560 [Streptomyces bambusae]|uniref:hypothetical protein n=1 Tax=Streptomyces bambusae TaxID=1550616 RepID=UPI001CFDD4E9|nr:hypothetical protein [Streptomyces bambusae]MCB5167409.1 hypothetical protein [Streptomyces bambusae]
MVELVGKSVGLASLAALAVLAACTASGGDEGPKRVGAGSAVDAGRGCELPVTFELGTVWTVKDVLVPRGHGGFGWDSLCELEAGSGGARVRLGVSVPPAGRQVGSPQEAMDDYEGVTMANYGEYESDWRTSQLRVAGRPAVSLDSFVMLPTDAIAPHRAFRLVVMLPSGPLAVEAQGAEKPVSSLMDTVKSSMKLRHHKGP